MAGRPRRRARRNGRARRNSNLRDFRTFMRRKYQGGTAAPRAGEPSAWGAHIPLGGDYKLSVMAGYAQYSDPRADQPHAYYDRWEVALFHNGDWVSPKWWPDPKVKAFASLFEGVTDGPRGHDVAPYMPTADVQRLVNALEGAVWNEANSAPGPESEEERGYDWQQEQESRERQEARDRQETREQRFRQQESGNYDRGLMEKFLSVCDRVRRGATVGERNAARGVLMKMVDKYPGLNEAANEAARRGFPDHRGRRTPRKGCVIRASTPAPEAQGGPGPYAGPARVERDGKVAVLFSPGFGSGWTTWAVGDDGMREIMLFHPLFVELVQRGGLSEGAAQAVFSQLGIDERDMPYLGGFDDLAVSWVEKGALFKIREYDGSESIEVFRPDSWTKANPRGTRRPRRRRR